MRTILYGGGHKINIVRGFFRQDIEGNILGFRRAKDGLPYSRVRKTYTRTHPYPTITINENGTIEKIRHFKAEPHLKTAIIKLRAKGGYSINHLSQASGRSTSYIFKILNDARALNIFHFNDNRKLPRRCALLNARKKLFSCFAAFQTWLPFILGEEGEPP